MRERLGHWSVLVVLALAACGTPGDPADGTLSAARGATTPGAVTARGRIEPKDGILRVAGPSRPSAVIAKLLIDDGVRVEEGQPIAVLDTLSEHTSGVARARAELVTAQRALARIETLFRQGMAQAQLFDDSQLRVQVARAELDAAEAALAQDTVRSPIAGQVVVVHARAGERVGPKGIAELAQTGQMYAVAEVYETDIGRVRVGQRATAESPALDGPLTGHVERIGMKVGQLAAVDTDPAARTDARVVEVHIRLDPNPRAAAFSNLQVEVAIASE